MDAIELFHRVKEIENVYVGVGDCEHLRTLGAGIVSYWSAKFAQKLGRYKSHTFIITVNYCYVYAKFELFVMIIASQGL